MSLISAGAARRDGHAARLLLLGTETFVEGAQAAAYPLTVGGAGNTPGRLRQRGRR